MTSDGGRAGRIADWALQVAHGNPLPESPTRYHFALHPRLVVSFVLLATITCLAMWFGRGNFALPFTSSDSNSGAVAVAPTDLPPTSASTGGVVESDELGLTVHVAGAVQVPGVYQLAPGSRVQDAVVAAGGALPEAELTQLNLARELRDGEQILVFREGEQIQEAPSGGLININRATVTELQQLAGVGPVLAERIVSYRTQNGSFAQVEELMLVPGIGKKLFAQLVDSVSV